MKLLITFLSIFILTSCDDVKNQTKDETYIHDSFGYGVFKLRVDSVDYVIVRSPQGIAIIKHGNAKIK